MNEGYMTAEEIKAVGFASIGRDPWISRHATIYGAERIRIGDFARIDDHCLLNAVEEIVIGDYFHLATSCSIQAGRSVTIGNYCPFAAGVRITTLGDDYLGKGMAGPRVPVKHRNPVGAPLRIGESVVIGTNAVVLPGVTLIAYGAAVGALSLVNRNIPEREIWAGAPAHKIGDRRMGFFAETRAFENPEYEDVATS